MQLVRGVATDETTLFVVNPLLVLDCLDRRCVDAFFPVDFPNKAKAGKPQMIASLSIHQPSRDDCNLFLVQDWMVAVVASKTLVEDLRSHGFTGFSAVPVRTAS